MIGSRAVVTSSGFTFERNGDRVTVSGIEPRAAGLAVLEYLREVEPGRGKTGKIVAASRGRAAGRALQIVTVELAGGERRTITFDVGPSTFGRVRPLLEVVNVAIHVIAAAAALGAIGYLVKGLLGG